MASCSTECLQVMWGDCLKDFLLVVMLVLVAFYLIGCVVFFCVFGWRILEYDLANEVLGGIGVEQKICFSVAIVMHAIVLSCSVLIFMVADDPKYRQAEMRVKEYIMIRIGGLCLPALSCLACVLRLVGFHCPAWMPLVFAAISLLIFVGCAFAAFNAGCRGPKTRALLWGLAFAFIAFAFGVGGIISAHKDRDLWQAHETNSGRDEGDLEEIEKHLTTVFVFAFFPLAAVLLMCGTALLGLMAFGCFRLRPVPTAACCRWAFENCCSCPRLVDDARAKASSQLKTLAKVPAPMVMHNQTCPNASMDKRDQATQTEHSGSLEHGTKKKEKTSHICSEKTSCPTANLQLADATQTVSCGTASLQLVDGVASV